MRSNVKRLIELIETEGWEYSDQNVRDDRGVCMGQYRPPNQSYPRIYWCGADIDGDTYIDFEPDERALTTEIFGRRNRRITSEREARTARRLEDFLKTRT